MATRKTAGLQKDATGVGILQKAAKAIGSAVGTIAVTTGIAQAEGLAKVTGKAMSPAQKTLAPAVKKRTKKAATKKNPTMKRARVRKT